ncbi:MAG: PAS domain S-box protein [Bacteroidetes bacterium]|nr:PAS domain S-box protein [Bacteroidota bacterium]
MIPNNSSEQREIEILKRKVERERKARQQAEDFLEKRSLELFEANNQLKQFNEKLEEEIRTRNTQLVESELRYRTLVETAQDIIFNISTDGYFEFVNQVAKELFGYDESEIIGQHFTEFIDPDHVERVLGFYIHFRDKNEQASYLEFPIITRQGEHRWIGQKVRRVEMGNRVYFSAYARDITQQIESEKALINVKEELRKSEMKYRSMIENMELGIMEVDNHGIILNAYDRFCEMSGYSRQELVGQNAEELLLVPEFKAVMDLQHQQRSKGIADTYEIKLKRKDGEEIWVLISGAPFYNESGEVAGTAGIHYDITERKNLERDLQEARLKAEKAQMAEHEFLANMSHEIRTPLNSIIGMTHILKESPLNDEQHDLVKIITHSSRLLHSLINDILDVSKLEAGSVIIRNEDFNLLEILENIQNTFSVKAREKNIEVSLDINGQLDELVNGDPLLINQILMNLVGNAEKFTDQGKICIETEILPSESDDQIQVRFAIHDSGIGISQEQLPHIFDKFHQAAMSSTKRHGGTGLGLTITQKLLQLLGSEVSVTSEEEKGSTFSFTISFGKTGKLIRTKEKTGNEWELHASVRSKRALVAEDNKLNQKYLDMLLAKVGINYDLAENGAEAIQMAAQNSYDIILMDIQMPGVDGFEATARIREITRYNDVPIIALSAMTMSSHISQLEEAGLDDLLPKPFTPRDLYTILNYYLGYGSVEPEPEFTESEFHFSKELDRQLLIDSYDNDIEYAADIFSTFLSNTPDELKRVQEFIKQNKTAEIRTIIHRIKPTFQMVGLPAISVMCSDAEKLADEKNEDFMLKVNEITDAFESTRSLIISELERMQNYIKQLA